MTGNIFSSALAQGDLEENGLKRKQMNVNEENESVWHTLPAQKKKKSKHPHSLNASVVANRAGEKKH